MTRDTIIPDSRDHWLKLRAQNLNSTEIAALFDTSPYMTLYDLWHRKKSGDLGEIEETERMRIGRTVESAIAALWSHERKPHDIRGCGSYFTIPELRLGTSVDYIAHTRELDHVIVECKNVDSLVFARDWEETDFGVEAPLHIELQVQHQMLVTGYERDSIAALIGGNRLVILDRQADAPTQAAILERAAEFWKSIDENRPPPPVFPDDARTILRRFQYADPGKLYDGPVDRLAQLAAAYKAAGDAEAKAKDDKETVRAQIIEIIGDAERAQVPGFSISAGVVGPTLVPAYERKGYRNFRVTPKKEK